MPQMSPIHFDILEPALASCGYKLEILPSTPAAVDYGLKYVNNDACYPSLIVVGQFMEALLSGEYDLDKVALIITQTGGGCRAPTISVYPPCSRKGRHGTDSGYLHQCRHREEPRLKIHLPMLTKRMQALIYGDLFMRVLYTTRPYEAVPGSANALHEKWESDLHSAPSETAITRNFSEIFVRSSKSLTSCRLTDDQETDALVLSARSLLSSCRLPTTIW